MSFLLTRMFAYFTVVMYLVVGSVAVRVLAPEMTTVSFTTSYSKLLSNTDLEVAQAGPVIAPEMSFAEIKMPVEKKVVRVARVVRPVERRPAVVTMVIEKVEENELPFHEAVTLLKITMDNQLDTNLLANYREFSF